MKAQVKNDQLLRALNNATLFKGDDARPLLQSTEMTFVDATTIRFVTTDSFALLHETVEAEVPKEIVGQTRLVNLIDAKPMLAALKANDKYGATLIELGDDRTSVTFEEIGSRATFVQKVEGTYPAWKELVKEWDGVQATGTLGLGQWQLGRLAKIRPVEQSKAGDATMRFEIIDNSRPIRVTIGQAMWVMVMPVRL
jgi:hypothetical protein